VPEWVPGTQLAKRLRAELKGLLHLCASSLAQRQQEYLSWLEHLHRALEFLTFVVGEAMSIYCAFVKTR